MHTVIVYGLISAMALAGGGVIAAFWPPSAQFRSYIQHVAAGFVFAAAGVEVLPGVLHRGMPWAAAIGFAIGVALMLAIESLSGRTKEGSGASARALVGVISADTFIDGILIGVSSAVLGAQRQAFLVTIALAAELASLGLITAAKFNQGGASRRSSILTTSMVSLSPLVGSVIGYLIGGILTPGWIEGVMALAVAAFLYLAAEELLTEAHEVPETVATTTLFMGAFLALLLIDMLLNKG